MERMDSPFKNRAVLVPVFSIVALGFALALALAVGGADGKGKKRGGGSGAPKVLSATQSQIVSTGLVSVQGGRGTVVVQGTAGGKVVGSVTRSYKAKAGKTGKTKSARSAAVKQAPLTEAGRQLLNGCGVDALRARATFRKGKKKVSRSSSTPLNRDLGVCSVGYGEPDREAVHRRSDRHG